MLAKTSIGTFRGMEYQDYTLFKGIPYAKAKRYEMPEPIKPFHGVYAADTFGPIAPQLMHEIGSFYQREFFSHQEAMSEDCLYLNIWTPAKSADEKLPVLFWIHGGAFTGGYGYEKEFDGEAFCKRGVILVTINYRMGVLGFFAHPELETKGNLGLYDQLAALQFVYDHIEAFGGDPHHITIMGQSAGAMSCQYLCTSPLSKGMIHQAIMQSAAGPNSIGEPLPYEKNSAMIKKMCDDLGYSAEDIKTIPYKVLIEEVNGYLARNNISSMDVLSPNIDGEMIPAYPDTLLEEGKYLDIPYIFGCTKNELFDPGTAKAIYNSTIGFAKIQSSVHEIKPYVYYFERDLPGSDDGAFHSAELWYEFGTLERCWRPFEEIDTTISTMMTDYFASFVKYGDPNHVDHMEWPSYDKGAILHMGTTFHVEDK